MVYDDDTGSTQFNDINDEDLRRRRETRIGATESPGQPVEERIRELAEQNREWGEQRIHAVLSRTRPDITLDMVYVVMAELRRSGRPGQAERQPATPPEARDRHFDSERY